MFCWLRKLSYLSVLGSFAYGGNGESTSSQIADKVPHGSALSDVDYFGYETIQLTPGAIANLSSQNPNATDVYGFWGAGTGRTTNTSSPNCKLMPGDAEWPSDSQWQDFNNSLGGALIQGVPTAAVCYPDWPQYDEARCAEVTELWTDPEWQSVFQIFRVLILY